MRLILSSLLFPPSLNHQVNCLSLNPLPIEPMSVRPTSRTVSFLGYLMVSISALSWGTWPFILRYAEQFSRLTPQLESVLVFLIIAVSTAPFAWLKRTPQGLSYKNIVGLIWLAASNALSILCVFAAYRRTSVAIAVLLRYCMPVFSTLAAPFFVRDKLSKVTWLAMALSLFGLFILLAPWEAYHRAHDIRGCALALLSAIFYASTVLMNKWLVSRLSAMEIISFNSFIASGILSLFVSGKDWCQLSFPPAVIIGMGGMGPGALGAFFFVKGLRKISAVHASLLTLLEPLVAVVGASLMLHEALSLNVGIGGLFIGIGAILVMIKG
ncbi:DMT family transporter [Pajaroellobacter abortibovis]|uniref:DMT family transporter n=1 Tax=Pajaroellobacter abortibovis TaxID=1882918 RepID=UPI0012EBD9BF|nr:DMT family transporter [Pajaroellobacter abortibovis]